MLKRILLPIVAVALLMGLVALQPAPAQADTAWMDDCHRYGTQCDTPDAHEWDRIRGFGGLWTNWDSVRPNVSSGPSDYSWTVAGNKDWYKTRWVFNDSRLPDEENWDRDTQMYGVWFYDEFMHPWGGGWRRTGGSITDIQEGLGRFLNTNDTNNAWVNWSQACPTDDEYRVGQYCDQSYEVDETSQGRSCTGAWILHLETPGGSINPEPFSVNYGQVATVGELRAFIQNELDSGVGSWYYQYQLEWALAYLDLAFKSESDPISYLCIPPNDIMYCLPYNPSSPGEYPKIIPASTVVASRGTVTEYSERRLPPGDALNIYCDETTDEDGWWEYAYESEIGMVSDPDAIDVEGPYGVWTVIEDQSPNGVGQYPFLTQREYKLTPFGEKVKEVCSAPVRPEGCDDGTTFTSSEIAQLKDAAANSDNGNGPKLDLTPTNEQSFAQGRLLQVSQEESSATIRRFTVQDRYMRRWHSLKTWYDGNGNVIRREEQDGPWEYAEDPVRDRQAGESTFFLGTSEWKKGFQMLINHCNGQAFDEALGSTSARNYSIDKRDSPDHEFTGTYLAASAVSDVYTDPMERPWGVTGPTAETGFYDKVCSYAGTRTDADNEARASGAEWGDAARSFTKQFRNGKYERMDTAYYTPTEAGWVDYKGDGPTAVTVTRWEEGTPAPGTFFLAGEDAETGGVGDGLFGTHHRESPTLKQWTNSDFNSDTVAISQGNYKRVLSRGLWASEKARPQVLTIKWDFKPEVATVTPNKRIGFGPGAAGDHAYEANVVGARVKGQVLSSPEDGRRTVPANFGAWTKYTGSGTTNHLDRPVPYGTHLNDARQWVVSPDKHSPYYYVVEYLRAVGH